MLIKLLQNKKIAVSVLLIFFILIAGVFTNVSLQEHEKSDVAINTDNNVREETENQDNESQNTGFEILEDDSKTQTESVDAPVSWEENHENNIGDKSDKTDTTEKTDSSLPSENQDKDTNMPIENVPDDEDVEYGSIF